MASRAATAEFEARARKRLADAVERFRVHLAMDPPQRDAFYNTHKPEYRAALDIEQNAKFLEMLADKLGLPAGVAPVETEPQPAVVEGEEAGDSEPAREVVTV